MTWLMRRIGRMWVYGVWALLWAWGAVQAQDLQPVPALTARIMDTSATLSANDLGQIEQQLAALEQRSGAQVVVLLLPSTAPEDIFSYANRVANIWKIGRKAVGDGLLIVVAVQDRRMRIEVAKTLEGAVPDLAARQIIERDLTPAFKRGDYAGGLTQAIDVLGRRIAGEDLPAPPDATAQERAGNRGGDQWMVLLIGLLVVSQVLRSLLGRGAGALVSGVAGAGLAYVFTFSLLLALGAGVVTLLWTFMSGLSSNGLSAGRGRGARMGGPWGGGGWGGGGGGSGGFSSGGGGDFGGGGASGNW